MANEITIKIDDVETKDKKELTSNRDGTVSLYARFFDETCPAWCKESETNLLFLRTQQTYANDLLRSRGYLFLNDVYDMLGIPRTKAGQVVGWCYGAKNVTGDNFVDFGLYNQRNEGFINGYERSALLDFNVDGMILDKLS